MLRFVRSAGVVVAGAFVLSSCASQQGGGGMGDGMSAPATQPAAAAPAGKADWSMNATIIEACSCPMFCQCYFNLQPASHGPGCCLGGQPGTYCKANNAYRVNQGKWGDVPLDGAKFWLSGDLGGDFSKGELDWAVVAFDPAVTPEQREGIKFILGRVYPAKWKSFT